MGRFDAPGGENSKNTGGFFFQTPRSAKSAEGKSVIVPLASKGGCIVFSPKCSRPSGTAIVRVPFLPASARATPAYTPPIGLIKKCVVARTGTSNR